MLKNLIKKWFCFFVKKTKYSKSEVDEITTEMIYENLDINTGKERKDLYKALFTNPEIKKMNEMYRWIRQNRHWGKKEATK